MTKKPVAAMLRKHAAAMPEEVRDYFREQGSIGGKKGGRLSWDKLTPEARSARAKHASEAAVKARQKRKGQV